MKETIDNTITALKNGNVVLYPTDTIVGLGCDATNIDAFNKVFEIKQRPKDKALIVLVSSDAMLNKYVSEVPELAWDLMDCSDKPVTIIYSNPKNLPQEILVLCIVLLILIGPVVPLILAYVFRNKKIQ